MHVAIIPARGGSKRLPRKNIKSFNGAPIISYAIQTALKSGLYDRIIVSTDDNEIALLAQQYGAETPFKRNHELSGDNIPTVPVIKDALLKSFKLHSLPEFVTAIYPCTPMLEPDDLITAAGLIKDNNINYIFPVCAFPSPPERALHLDKTMKIASVNPEFAWVRTQDLECSFFDAGQFYCGKTETWLNETELHNGSKALIFPFWKAVDIDTPEDWKFAELIYNVMSPKNTND